MKTKYEWNVKNRRRSQSDHNAKHTQLLQLAIVCLAVVSFFTTAQGMDQYIFSKPSIAYTASAAIQGILVALSMNLPRYLKTAWRSFGGSKSYRDSREALRDTLKMIFTYILKVLLCCIILALTVLTLFCSSWFSYVYIADVVHRNSWETDSELLVQQTYRNELYNAINYAQAYRIYLEEDLGKQILSLESRAKDISKDEQLESSVNNWKAEREKYVNNDAVTGSYMVTAIDAMEKVMQAGNGTDSAQNARDLAIQAITEAQNNMNDRMEAIDQEQEKLEKEIDGYNSRVDSYRSMINNAVEGTDTAALTNALNSYVRQIENDADRITGLQQEYSEFNDAIARLHIYESILGLTNSTSFISIREDLLKMQSEFFKEDPDEEKMIDSATQIFDNMRNAAVYNDSNASIGDDTSYTELMLRMNQLLSNLKNYSDIKEIEDMLEVDAEELWNEKTPDENINTDNEAENWKITWRERLQKLKAQISAIPAYNQSQVSEEENDYTSQPGILESYDRIEANNQLDEMIRLYIDDHSPLYQGIIYLNSPYRELAVFSLFLALAFDLSGFIFGFIMQGYDEDDRVVEQNSKYYIGPYPDDNYDLDECEEGDLEKPLWSIMDTRNDYMVITGDYTKTDNEYTYSTFVHGLPDKWKIENDAPYGMGVYLQDSKEKTKIVPIKSEQPLIFAKQKNGPIDGAYLKCDLSFDEGSLLLKKKTDNEYYYLTSINEYVPVHLYNSAKGESLTMPAQELDNVAAETLVIALNDNGTRIAEIYVMQ